MKIIKLKSLVRRFSIRTLFPRPLSVRSVLSSRVLFCLAAALAVVALRMIIFDYPVFFHLHAVPSHDMYQGSSFFATSMHSVWLSGDIAWWNPVASNGYAQYYQSFLSPLAPTSHHIVFILWAQAIRLFSLFGLHFPEYKQYLVVTYVVLPFLTFAAFTAFVSQIFRRRSTVFLVLLVYAFSGIGLWNSAWFYFQEPFTFFLLLATTLAALRRPTPRRMLLVLAAALIQLTSFNYWTVYNAWFLMILAGAYWAFYPNRVRRLFVRARTQVKRHRAAALVSVVLFGLTLVMWGVIMGSIVAEQSGQYVGQNEPYKVMDAYGRVQEVRTFTSELFDPNIRRALASFMTLNEMHNARYIGVFLLPLLVVVGAYNWRRRERWLLLTAVGVLVVCIAPPFLLSLWEVFPFMSKVRHLFYFYTQYWQLLITLLAGAGMEILLNRTYDARPRRLFIALNAGLAISALAVFIGFSAFSHKFPIGDPSLQSNLYAALLLLISSLVVLNMLRFPGRRNRRIFVFVILALAATDLTRYFWEVSRFDRAFTETRWHTPPELPPEVQQALARRWPDPDLSKGFGGGLDANLPVASEFWPVNIYMKSQAMLRLRAAPEEFQRRALERFFPNLGELSPNKTPGEFQKRAEDGPPLEFYSAAVQVPDPERINGVIEGGGDLFTSKKVLLLQGNTNPELQVAAEGLTAVEPITGFTYRFRQSLYNSFDFELTAPRDGWLYIKQLADPRWRLILDGQRVKPLQADLVGMALPVRAGWHQVHMEYRPLARRLYWSGCLLLSLTLATLLILSLLSGPSDKAKG